MRKREEDHLIGMWKHPMGGWEIKYQKDGKESSEYRKDKKEAELRAQYWKATLEEPPRQVGEDGQEHPVLYWEKMLRRIAELAINNPGDKDISTTCRALASAATAALRSAKYLPAPGLTSSPDSAPIQGEIGSLTTEQLKELMK